MTWLSNFFDGALDYLIDGPLGGVRLRILGEYYSLSSQLTKRRWRFFTGLSARRKLTSRQMAFFTAIFSMLSKMAIADGQVTTDEIIALEKFMKDELGLNAKQKTLAIQIFRTAKGSSESFREFALQYHSLFKRNPVMLEGAVSVLLGIALADKQFTFDEQRLMNVALQVFSMGLPEYERIKHQHNLKSRITARLVRNQIAAAGKAEEESTRAYSSTDRVDADTRMLNAEDAGLFYQILGCSPSETSQQIKTKYRKLVLKYHPDRLLAQGLPPEFIEQGEKRFKEIQNAYDAIMESRGVK